MQSHLNQEQLQHFSSKLLQARTQLAKELEHHVSIKQMSSDLNLSTELSKIDNHLADQATDMYDQERDIAIYHAGQRRLARMDEALQRIQEHSYGICDVCGEPISLERLEALPEASACLQHAPHTEARQSSYEYQPIAMEQLNMDDRDFTFFDGEDSIQAVLRYGNSSYGEAITMLDTEFAQELVDELVGFCEPLESFVATDITGEHVYIVRNNAYQRYVDNDEGDQELEQL